MGAVLLHPLAPLVILALAETGFRSAYLSAGWLPSARFERLLEVGWVFLLFCWLAIDMRRRGRRPCFDFGLFAWVAYPFSVIGYCYWSRGWRGLFLMLLLFVLWIGPWYVSWILYTGFLP